MEIQLKEVEGILVSLHKIFNSNQVNSGLKFNQILKWAKEIKNLELIFGTFSKMRDSLIAKYGMPIDGKANSYRVPPENIPEFNREINTIITEKVEITNEKISLNSILSAWESNKSINPIDIKNLMIFINPEELTDENLEKMEKIEKKVKEKKK